MTLDTTRIKDDKLVAKNLFPNPGFDMNGLQPTIKKEHRIRLHVRLSPHVDQSQRQQRHILALGADRTSGWSANDFLMFHDQREITSMGVLIG